MREGEYETKWKLQKKKNQNVNFSLFCVFLEFTNATLWGKKLKKSLTQQGMTSSH